MGRKAKSGGDRRTEIISVRLNPRLRHLAEIAARKHRRALSNFIEWAIEEILKQIPLCADGDGNNLTIEQAASSMWSVYEPDRFVKLAFRFPELLTHEEQILWALIRENSLLWRMKRVRRGTLLYFPTRVIFSESEGEHIYEYVLEPKEPNLIIERLREHWETFKKVASGELGEGALPKEYDEMDMLLSNDSASLED